MIARERGRVVAIVICVVLIPTRLLAQPSLYYVYDALNRLIAVVDQQGSAATYTYDSVGNILSIDRFDTTGTPGTVAISMFAPSAGAIGTTVQVFGRGFATTIAQNSLSFGGERATILAAAPTRLVAKVPDGAQTAPIVVTTPLGSATSARAFRVVGQLLITPEALTLPARGHAAFTVSESGVLITNVRWAVNDLTGGDARIGTIGADGVYTAPATVPVPPVVTITATHHDDAGVSASASVTVLPPLILSVSSRPVSVGAAAALVVDRSIGVALSVAADSPNRTTLARSPSLAVALEPVVLGIAPSVATPGQTLSLTLSGRGLEGATSVVFLRNGTTDSAFTVMRLVVDADGTRATLDAAIAADALPGARVVQITTPTRMSSPAGTGGNVFTLQ
jgi:YD repeat-containing protein